MISDDAAVLTADVGNPFPGLRPFEESDNIVFFGRDSQIEALLERLEDHRFVAVVGDSASGKSSLVRAGLLPALRGGFMAGAGARWRVAVLRPGNAPTANLAVALEEAGVLGAEGTNALRTGLARAVLEDGERGLIEVVAQAGLRSDENVLVIVDQFEELFRFQQDHDGAAAFVKLLLAAAADPAVPIYILITMRSDFLGDCAQFRDLPETINDGLFLVPRLTRDELREVIAGPVGVVDAEISPLLVNQLLNEIGDSPDQLPVLQHALMRTWEQWTARGSKGVIDVADFEATGGLARALSVHGDALFGVLSFPLQLVAEKLFKALTDRGTDDRGVRRATPFSQLPAIIGASEEDVRAVIEEFRGPGRSFVMPPSQALDEATIIDIAHESLMRVWDRLEEWAQEEADSVRLYRRLSDAAQLYAKGEGALLVDPQLTIATNWRERSQPTAAWAERNAPGFLATMAFVDASVAERARLIQVEEDRQRREREDERRALEAEEAARRAALEHQAEVERTRADAAREITRRTRGYLYLMSLVAVIAIGLGIFALVQRNGTLESQSRFLARDAETAISQGDAVTGMLLALEGLPKNFVFGIPLDRPLVVEPEYALEDAVSNQLERKDIVGEKSVNFAAFAPNGRAVVSAASDNTLRIWGTPRAAWTVRPKVLPPNNNGVQLALLTGHTGAVRSATYSPDGTRIASSSDDATVRIWNATGGDQSKALRVFTGHEGPVNSVAFSPDGKRLVSASSDRTIRIWDVATGRQLRVLRGHTDIVRAVAFSPDSRHVASASDDRTIRIWDSTTGAQTKVLRGHTGLAFSVAYSHDGQRIVSGSLDKTIRVWDAASGDQLAVLTGNDGLIFTASFSSDDKRIITASLDKTIRLWDSLSYSQVSVLRGHDSYVTSASFSPNGRYIVSSSSDKTVRFWSSGSARGLVAVLSGHSDLANSGSFSPDGKRIVSTSLDRTVRIWDAATGTQLMVLPGHESAVLTAVYSRDGKRIVSASSDKTARVWDATTGALIKVLPTQALTVQSAAFSPDGRQIVTAGGDGTVRIWDASSFKLVKILKGHTGPVYGAAFSPDGKRIVSASADQTVRIWDTSSGESLLVLTGHQGAVYTAGFSNDGGRIVSASADQTVRIWDASNGSTLAVLRGHADVVHSAVFSPDGKYVASSSYDRTIRIWEATTGIATTGVQIAVLRGHTDSVYGVAYSPDGKQIVSASWDKTLRIWKSPNPTVVRYGEELIARERNAAPRKLSDPQLAAEFLPTTAPK